MDTEHSNQEKVHHSGNYTGKDALNSAILDEIDVLFEAFPKTKVKDGTKIIYAESLSQFTPENVRHAVRQHIKTSKFLPAVSELIAIINSRGERKQTQGYVDGSPEGERIRQRILDRQWGPNAPKPSFIWPKGAKNWTQARAMNARERRS